MACMKWINVKERLPEYIGFGIEVLVFRSGILDKFHICIYFGKDPIFKGGHHWNLKHGKNKYAEDVTHWMPLPNPPED
jgi:Protein of unknown function (DUF551)